MIHEKWQDDFSKARNTAIEHAKSDWILFMDAEVKKEDVAKILPLLNDDTVEAYIFKFVNYGGSNVSDDFAQIHYNFKLFRNNGKLKYVYPIHENLKNVADDREPIYKKADITMLSDYLLKNPNDMFQHVNLGVEYFNAGEYRKANTTAGTGSYKTRYMIAFCYEKLGQLHDAVQEYTKLLIAKPGYGQVFRKLFEIFVKNEKPGTVREFFDKYVEKTNPANQEICRFITHPYIIVLQQQTKKPSFL